MDLDLDKTAKSLKPFRDLLAMRGAGLNGVHKKDILAGLNRSLTALDFWNVRTKSLDLSLLGLFPDLQYLTVNARAVIDARTLAALPRLTELQLWNFKQIEHAEALLECPSLERASLKYIKEGGIGETLREAMKARFSYVEFA